MITLEDCVAFCGLTKEEVLAIAKYEQMPASSAAALAESDAQKHGTERIRDMIIKDISASQAPNDREHVLNLLHALHHFLRTPLAQPSSILGVTASEACSRAGHGRGTDACLPPPKSVADPSGHSSFACGSYENPPQPAVA